jgi:hypothetical protein
VPSNVELQRRGTALFYYPKINAKNKKGEEWKLPFDFFDVAFFAEVLAVFFFEALRV